MSRKMSMPVDELKAYIREWAGKKNAYQMRLETGAGEKSIRNFAAQMHLSLVLIKEEQERQKVKEFIEQNHWRYTAYEAAKQLNVAPAVVYGIARRLGVVFKKSGRYKNAVQVCTGGFFNPNKYDNWVAY